MSGLHHAFTVEIRAAPERVWEALTDPRLTRRWYWGQSPQTDWKVGSPIRYQAQDGQVGQDGEILDGGSGGQRVLCPMRESS